MLNRILKITILAAVFFSIFTAIRIPHIADAHFYVGITDLIRSQMAVFTPEQLGSTGTHPLLVPLCYALLGKLAFPAMYAGLLFVFYWNLRRHISETLALMYTFFLTGFPLILYHSFQVYCDLPMAFFYTGGVIYLYEYFCKRRRADLVISAVFLGLGVHTKASGFPLWATAGGALVLFLLFERRWMQMWFADTADWFIFWGVSFSIAAPWLICKGSLINQPAKLGGKIGSGQIVVNSYLGEVSLTAWNLTYWICKRFFTCADWQLLWFAFVFVAIFYFPRIWKSNLKYLLLIVLINLGMVFYIFAHPNYFQWLVDGTMIQRLVMHFAPVGLYFVALAKEGKE